MTDLSAWIPAEIAALSLSPDQGRTEWFQHWANFEGTGAAYNPLATTLDTNPARRGNPPFWNNIVLPSGAVIHVMNYASMGDGVEATKLTIQQGNFGLILQSLVQRRVLAGVAAVIRSAWGTTGFANELQAGWTPTGWASDYTLTAPAQDPSQALSDAQRDLVTTIGKALIDGSIGELFLTLMEQMVGISPSTYGTVNAGRVLAVQAALRAAPGSRKPHTHPLALQGMTGADVPVQP